MSHEGQLTTPEAIERTRGRTEAYTRRRGELLVKVRSGAGGCIHAPLTKAVADHYDRRRSGRRVAGDSGSLSPWEGKDGMARVGLREFVARALVVMAVLAGGVAFGATGVQAREATEALPSPMTVSRLLASRVPASSYCRMPAATLVNGVHPGSHVYPDRGPTGGIAGYGPYPYGPPDPPDPPGTFIGDLTGDGVADGLIEYQCKFDTGSNAPISYLFAYGANGASLGQVRFRDHLPSSAGTYRGYPNTSTIRIVNEEIKFTAIWYRQSDAHCCPSGRTDLRFRWTPSGFQRVTGPSSFTNWVAVGDSYSSGEGSPPFDTDTDGNRCHRSPKAWPRLLRTDHHLACTGATIDDIYGSQRDALAALNQTRPVDAVTVTIGGNDIGFADVLGDCFLSLRCSDPLINNRIDGVAQRLADAQGNGVYHDLETAAPTARVVVVGYPRLFPTDYADVGPSCRPVWAGPTASFGRSEVAFLNAASAHLDRRLREAAGRAGVRYISTFNALEGHELCTSDPWIRPINETCFRGLSTLCAHPWERRDRRPVKHGQQRIADIVQRAQPRL